jgi:hypothetical protein
MSQDYPNKISNNNRKLSSTVLLWIIVITTYIWMAVTMSAGGHASIISTIGIFPAFFYACCVFFRIPRKGFVEQFLGSVAFALIAIMFIKNIIDVFFGAF